MKELKKLKQSRLNKGKLLSCEICGSNSISKSLMSPSVNSKENKPFKEVLKPNPNKEQIILKVEILQRMTIDQHQEIRVLRQNLVYIQRNLNKCMANTMRLAHQNILNIQLI